MEKSKKGLYITRLLVTTVDGAELLVKLLSCDKLNDSEVEDYVSEAIQDECENEIKNYDDELIADYYDICLRCEGAFIESNRFDFFKDNLTMVKIDKVKYKKLKKEGIKVVKI